MSRVLLIFVFLVKIISVTSQTKCNCNHFYNYYEAEKLYYSGKFDSSVLINKYIKSVVTDNFGDLSHLLNTIDKLQPFADVATLKALILQAGKKGGSFTDVNEFISRYPNLTIKRNEIIDSLDFKNYEAQFQSNLDSFLIKELLWLSERDQYIRSNDSLFSKYEVYVESSIFDMLQKLIKLNNNKLPKHSKIGPEASSCLTTLLMHMSIKNLSTLLPYVLNEMYENEFYDNTNIIYQIDRNHIGNDSIYKINLDDMRLYPFLKNVKLHPKAGMYQFYGGIDLFDNKSRKKYFWPFHPSINKETQKEMYNVLCLPTENFGFPPSKLNPEIVSNKTFLNFLQIEVEK